MSGEINKQSEKEEAQCTKKIISFLEPDKKVKSTRKWNC